MEDAVVIVENVEMGAMESKGFAELRRVIGRRGYRAICLTSTINHYYFLCFIKVGGVVLNQAYSIYNSERVSTTSKVG